MNASLTIHLVPASVRCSRDQSPSCPFYFRFRGRTLYARRLDGKAVLRNRVLSGLWTGNDLLGVRHGLGHLAPSSEDISQESAFSISLSLTGNRQAKRRAEWYTLTDFRRGKSYLCAYGHNGEKRMRSM